MSTYPKTPPPFTYSGGNKTVFGPEYANASDEMYIDSKAAGWLLNGVTQYIINSTAALVVEVEAPDGTYQPPPPGDTPTSVDAGEVVVLKGRWNSFKFTTTGTVTLIGDHTLGAWQ